MILTGECIEREVAAGGIVIDPFDPRLVEPNSYGFHLGGSLLRCGDPVIDARRQPHTSKIAIPAEGYVLEPGQLYLGETLETLGSPHYAATLYANRSTSCLGMWIQVSAPLGHTGAVIPWTLEIVVAHPVVVFPGMLIGKIAFWTPQGVVNPYQGKYHGSRGVVGSRMAKEMTVVAEVRS